MPRHQETRTPVQWVYSMFPCFLQRYHTDLVIATLVSWVL